MSRVVLVHWNAAEAEVRVAGLRIAGYNVACHCDPKANPRELLADPPNAFVIDLARLPSQGRELGAFLRRSPAARHIPLVFLEGDPAKTDRVRALLPDATFTTWDRVLGDLPAALSVPPADPVVPGAMDAYAGASLPKKLGVKTGSRILLVGAPRGFETALDALPAGAHADRRSSEPVDIVLLFVTSRARLAAGLRDAETRVRDGGRLWILWPRAAGRRKHAPTTASDISELTQSAVRAHGLSRGWVDYKVSSIDETWAGLCFARRKMEREAHM